MKIISRNWCTTVCGLSFLLLFMLWGLFCWFSGFRASSKTKAPNSNLISVFCFSELNSHTRTLTHKQSSWIIIYKKMMNLPVGILLYIELTISFLIVWKCTVNFQNQCLWHHLPEETSKSCQGHSRSQEIVLCMTVVHEFLE